MPDLLVAATVIVALGCGLNAGVFFAFSSFVMKALDRLPAPEGIAAMQSINVAALTPSFMTALFGTAAACLGLAAWAIVDWHGSVSPWLLIGGALYLAGPIGLTAAYHQPRNLALATVQPRRGGGGTWRSGPRSITSGRWRRWARPRRCRWRRSPAEPPKYHPGDSARTY
jgi:uncharacterized membrane protein